MPAGSPPGIPCDTQGNGINIQMTQKPYAPAAGASRAVLALAWAGCLAFAADDQAAEATETELAPVTSSAHPGEAVGYNKTGASVTVLDLPRLQRAGIISLSEALTTAPGVFTLPGGGDYQQGNVSNIAIRGMSSGTCTLPVVDGMRLNAMSDAGNVTPNVIARTDLHTLGNAEILRGSQGATYGGGAMGGVLWMETPKGSGEPSCTLFNEAGSHDTYTGSLKAQGECGPLAYFVGATYTHTNNDIRFANGTAQQDKHAGRYVNRNEAIRLDYQLNENTTLTTTYRREDAEYRDAPMGGDVTPYRFRTNLATARLASKISEDFSSSLMAGYYGSDSMFGHGCNYNLRNVQIEWRNRYRWNKENKTTAGFAWNRSAYDDKSSPVKSLENVYGFFAEHTFSPTEHWENSLAARLDSSNIYHKLITLRAATSATFNNEKTRVFASAGRGYRAPGQLQRSNSSYAYFWSTYHGNPNLECETSYSVDLGAEQEIAEGHTAGATLFWIERRHAIETVYNGYDAYFRNAEARQIAKGIELSLKGKFDTDDKHGYRVAYTYTAPRAAKHKQIVNSARQCWSAELYTTPLPGFTTGLGLTAAVGRTNYKAERSDNYYTLRWFAQYEVNDNLTLHLRIENLTNQKFVTAPGYTDATADVLCPGISIYGGCTVKF